MSSVGQACLHLLLVGVEWFHFKETGGRSLCFGLVLNPSTIKNKLKTMCSRDVYVSEIEGPGLWAGRMELAPEDSMGMGVWLRGGS